MMTDTIAPWDTPSFGMHPLDVWLTEQDLDAWYYASPGHLVGPDAKPQDDFDRLPDFRTWLGNVRADLKRRCRLPKRPRKA